MDVRTWTDQALQEHVDNVASSTTDRRLSECDACQEASERGITSSVALHGFADPDLGSPWAAVPGLPPGGAPVQIE